jgi:hypothetical protein
MIAARCLVAFAAMALILSAVGTTYTECVFQSADTEHLESA